MKVQFLTLVLVLVPPFAVAAPVPKVPTPSLVELFGTPEDPDKDCKFTLTGKTLRVDVPGKPHDMVMDRKLANPPRVMRPVRGEFAAEVTVKFAAPDGVKVAADKPLVIFKAGLLLVADKDHFAYHGDTAIVTADRTNRQYELGVRKGENSERIGSSGAVGRGESVRLRLERSGRKVRLLVCEEDANWRELHAFDDRLPDGVSVGVYAAHNGSTPFSAEFEGFSVTLLNR
jgi:regulation of enolase protein 1 (concanavalin A-like superfamily)